MITSFLDHCLLLDLETTVPGICGPTAETAVRILAIGAARGTGKDAETLAVGGSFRLDIALVRLAEMASRADRVLGHNLLGHDLEVLRALAPDHPVLRLPAVDTLYLSPLAFPENPYHHLVKDYKLVRESRNDPLADARLAARVFRDQWERFANRAARDPRLLAFYATCLGGADEVEGRGLAEALLAVSASSVSASVVGREPMAAEEAVAFFRQASAGEACATALRELAAGPRPAWAYALAWLGEAGGCSVLPPWVGRRFPETRILLDGLREQPCTEPGCRFCRSIHEPQAHLRSYFGFDNFRPQPEAPDGGSLQEVVVRRGLAGEPLLAILATGAGKSICFQLPALVRYLRRGLLTLVVSPLQALMKDQVDHLNVATGSESAAALYGLLTPPERGKVLERVRLGDVALLYVAPEQLRNRSFRRTVEQREIACWVFDEAHCLSKWGHDFRPDYLYAARFIRQLAKRQQMPVPPVACFTATAKDDVKGEIIHHFSKELGQGIEVFESRVDREELRFSVESVPALRKLERAYELLAETLSVRGGAAVVYCASRRGSREAAAYLAGRGLLAEAFHAGLGAPVKREILDAFVAGTLPVVCATNAFGMGIDKSDVRLVVHLDIPGSLESYLQEAGRAGRDHKASDCVLLVDDNDLEQQFRLLASSRLTRRDIAEILRGLRRARRDRNNHDLVTLTSAELLRDEAVETVFERDDWQADTKVKTAVSWLERAGFVERLENQTRVFQGRLRVKNLAEARQRVEQLRLSQAEMRRWLGIVGALLTADPDEGLTADEIAELPDVSWPTPPTRRSSAAREPVDAEPVGAEPVDEEPKPKDQETPGQKVLRTLHAMAEAGLVSHGLLLTAHLHLGGQRSARSTFESLCGLDRAFLGLLAELEPDAADGSWLELSLRPLNQRLTDRGQRSNPALLHKLLRSLAEDGKGLAGRRGSLDLRYRSRHRYRVRLLRSWAELQEMAEERRALGKVLLERLLQQAQDDAAEGGQPGRGASRGRVLVEFGLDDLTEALRRDLVLRSQLHDLLAAAERGLLFLHELGVIQLDNGLAVFRQAMSVHVLPQAKGRGYRVGDYRPLEQHYGERTFQVHVMGRYAQLGLAAIRQALDFVSDYFQLGKVGFVKRHFAGQEAMLKRATGEASYHHIVEGLGNPVQMAVVAAPADKNQLVLAGPGSGKTRVVVHRCAYLLRVERVPARGLLVLCFNKNAALEARRRLRQLVGNDARGVSVLTYHGLAMRLTGTSFATLAEREVTSSKPPNFNRLITDAVRLLRGEEELPGLTTEELREEVCAGFSHLLVDEYQDINAEQYELVATLAGLREEGPGEDQRKMALMAVGDDDQNIYGWSGTDVAFIRRFQEDYQAEVHYLTTCYRSTAYIIAAANQLISHNRERLKRTEPIVAREERERGLGGRWAKLEPENVGRVLLFHVVDGAAQAAVIAERLLAMQALDPELNLAECAVLARHHRELHPIRAALEACGLPVAWAGSREGLPPLHRVREIARFLERLGAVDQGTRRASQLERMRTQMAGNNPENPWWSLLADLLAGWREESANAELPTSTAREWLYESLVERGREPVFGEGVRLLTVHAAKGLEFEHVLLADGGWQIRTDDAASGDRDLLSEERRLYYVGMTRARQTLQLFARRDGRNPHVALLWGDFLESRDPAVKPLPPEEASRRYGVLTLSDLFLSFAGRQSPEDAVHRRLAALEPGALLAIRRRGEHLHLLDSSGSDVAALSRAGRRAWGCRLEAIEAVRVLALVERRSSDSESEYRARLQCERWEVPVVEVVYLPGASWANSR